MTRGQAAPRAPTFAAVSLPAPIALHHRNVTLCVDFFFVQGLGFLHTISRGIGFRTIIPVADRTHKTILRNLSAVIHLYTTRGLTICDIHADNEFECVCEELRPIAMNIVTAYSHVGEIERSICTIKEHLRSSVHGLPFRRLPKLMITSMVSDSVRCLNQVSWPHGILATLSHAAIVTGTPIPDFLAMRLEFGSYAQVFEDSDQTNTPRSRSLGAIALVPTCNSQGDFYFMSLATGANISRHHWTPLPIPDTAITRVEALALHEGRPLIQDRGFLVEWRPDHTIEDAEYDLDFIAPLVDPPDIFDLTNYDPFDPTELHDPAPDLFVPAPPAQRADNHTQDRAPIDLAPFPEVDLDVAPYDPTAEDDDIDAGFDDISQDAPPSEDDDEHHHEEQGAPAIAREDAPPMDEDEGAPHRYNLRTRVPTNERDTFRNAIDTPHDTKSYFAPTQLLQKSAPASPPSNKLIGTERSVFDYVMTQMATTCTQMSE